MESRESVGMESRESAGDGIPADAQGLHIPGEQMGGVWSNYQVPMTWRRMANSPIWYALWSDTTSISRKMV